MLHNIICLCITSFADALFQFVDTFLK